MAQYIETGIASSCLRVEPPLPERVRFLIGDYSHMLRNPAWLKERLAKLTELQPREVIQRWIGLIDAAAWEELVTDLLVNHYDPLYLRSMNRSYPTLDSAPVLRPERLDPEAVAQLARSLQQRKLPELAPA